MKHIFIAGFLIFTGFVFSQNIVNEQNLTKKANIIYYKNNPFSGLAYALLANGQIKHKQSFKDGVADGVYVSYFLDEKYNKSSYKDTAYINQLILKKGKSDSLILKVKGDTAMSYNKLTSYYEDEIGGEKKYFKLLELYEASNLKGKKLEVFQTHQKLDSIHKNNVNKLGELKKGMTVIEKQLSDAN
jgi:hypothetical protein